MHVKNLSARLITVNVKGTSTKIPPGGKDSVKLNKEQAETQFVESLIERGELVEVAAPKGEKPADESGTVTREDLQKQLDYLGVEYDNRWGIERLQKEIDANKGE